MTTKPSAIMPNALFTCGAISIPVVTPADAAWTHPAPTATSITPVGIRDVILHQYIRIALSPYIILAPVSVKCRAFPNRPKNWPSIPVKDTFIYEW